MDSISDNLDSRIKLAQYKEQLLLKKWAPTHNLSLLDSTHWYHGTALVVMADNACRRGVISPFLRPCDCWAHQNYQDAPVNHPVLLVAQPENLCH